MSNGRDVKTSLGNSILCTLAFGNVITVFLCNAYWELEVHIACRTQILVMETSESVC